MDTEFSVFFKNIYQAISFFKKPFHTFQSDAMGFGAGFCGMEFGIVF